MTPDPAGLTQSELATRAGVSLDRLQQLVELGVVRANETDGTFRPIDIQRIRIAEEFADSGLAIEDLGRLVAEGHITFPNLEAVFGEPIAVSDTSLAEFAAEIARDRDLLRRVYTQFGLTQPGDDDRLRADDLESLHEFVLVFDARDVGLGDDFLPEREPTPLPERAGMSLERCDACRSMPAPNAGGPSPVRRPPILRG